MPFAETSNEHTEQYWTDHYSLFLKPLIEEVDGVVASRSRALRGNILKEIIKDLINSHIVVAELTDLNANVFWELGVRQSFKHGLITIAEEGTKLPFDTDKIGTLFYNAKNIAKMRSEFELRFKEAIKDCIENPSRTDSDVLEYISGRGSLYEIISKEQSLRRIEALSAEIFENKRILDKVVEDVKEQIEESKNSSHKTTAPSVRFNVSALNLLLAERYLYLKDNQYETLISFSNWLIGYNAHLNVLLSTKEFEWFLTDYHITNMETLFKEVEVILLKAKEDLLEII
jgi:hypothetical protein